MRPSDINEQRIYDEGYEHGYADAYGRAEKEGERTGYNNGYNEAAREFRAEIDRLNDLRDQMIRTIENLRGVRS